MRVAILSESDFCPKYFDGTTIRLDSILNEFERIKSEILFIKLGAKSKCDKYDSISFTYPFYHKKIKNIKITRNFYLITWMRLFWHFRNDKFDFILIEGIWGSLYSTALSSANKHHSWIDSIGYVACKRVELDISNSVVLKMDALRKRCFEKCLSVFLKQISVVSELDKDFIGRKKIVVIPNGVDREFIRPERNLAKPKKILFFANFNGYMNRASLSFLDSKEFTDLLKLHNFEFYVGGLKSREAFSMLKFLNECALCIGPQKNISTLYEQFDIFIAPMTGGTGIKNSVLQALAGNMLVLIPQMNVGVYGNVDGLLGYSDEKDLFKILVDLRLRSFHINRRTFMLSNYSWSTYLERVISYSE